MERDLITVIEAQKEQIKDLDKHLRNLEVRVSMNEGLIYDLRKNLTAIKKDTSKTFWLLLVTFICVFIILGS